MHMTTRKLWALLAVCAFIIGCATAPPPPAPPPPPPPPPPVMMPEPPQPEEQTRGLTAAPRMDVKPVLVDLGREQDRIPANGGSAVVLLSSPNDNRGMWLCALLAQKFSRATVETVRVGVRRDASGRTEAVRPVYWLAARAADDNTCRARIAAYDYGRARILRDRFSLTGPGPFLLVANASGSRVSHIDLAGRTYAEMDAQVDMFRDAFAYENGIWDPAAQTSLREGVATRLVARGFTATLVRTFAFAVAPSARAGCPLNDLSDRTC
jgi:hypothetical protein